MMANAQNPTSIKALIQSLAPESLTVVLGEVIAAEPLEIRLLNDEKMVLRGDMLSVPPHLSDYEVTADIETDGADLAGETDDAYVADAGSHSHSLASFSLYGAKITIHNALKVGDRARILSYNCGKKYYVLDREA